jgi:IS605 OrfB family transposase
LSWQGNESWHASANSLALPFFLFHNLSMQTRVLQLKLRTVNRGKAHRLETMQQAFTDAVRLHLDTAYALPKPSVNSLHAACYHTAREHFPLPASTIQQARDKALVLYRSVDTRKRQGKKASRPRLQRLLPLRLAAENLRVFVEHDMVRVTTPGGFLWLSIVIPAVWRTLCALPHAVSEFVRRGRDWYLMLAVKSEDVPAPDGPHFGLDLGVANIAVLSGPEVVQFWDGKPLRYVRGRFCRYRQALQQKRKYGMVKRSKGKEARWATQRNHQVSREIVDSVAAHGGVLHVEKLLGIRDRVKMTRKVNRMVHSWPFAQLLAFITYKAALAGVQVIEEDPRHTSQRCSRCGHTERKNRQAQAAFQCRACEHRARRLERGTQSRCQRGMLLWRGLRD